MASRAWVLRASAWAPGLVGLRLSVCSWDQQREGICGAALEVGRCEEGCGRVLGQELQLRLKGQLDCLSGRYQELGVGEGKCATSLGLQAATPVTPVRRSLAVGCVLVWQRHFCGCERDRVGVLDGRGGMLRSQELAQVRGEGRFSWEASARVAEG